MTDQEILLKVIEVVKKNGLDCELSGSGNVVKMFRGKDETSEMPTIREFIFSHEFAKAFWGEDDLHWGSNVFDISWHKQQPAWEFHLQRMVLEKNPIKYLEKHS